MAFWDSMADGIDRIGRGIETIGEDAVRATREFTQIQKLRNEAAAQRRNINTQYLRLGKKYFERHRDDPDFSEDPIFCSIRESQSRAQECERQIELLREASAAGRAAAGESAAAQEAARAAGAEERTRRNERQKERAAAPEEDIDGDDFVREDQAGEDNVMDAAYYRSVEPADASDFEEDGAGRL